MKTFRKYLQKVLSVSCLLIVILSLAACGNSADTPSDVDPESVYMTARGIISVYDSIKPESYEQIESFSEEELQSVVDMLAQQGLKITSEAFLNGFESYKSAKEDLGDISEVSDLQGMTDKNGEITAHVLVTGTATRPDGLPRTADIEVVMSEGYTIGSAAFNVVQTTGEKLSHAGLNTLLGMGTTFSILILISIVIYLLSFVPKILEGGKKKEKAGSAVDKTIDQIIAKEESSAQKESTSDTELIAVISAAIAAYESSATGKNVTPDTFVVRSLKKH